MVQKNTVLLDDTVAVTPQWDLHLDVLPVRTYIRTNSDELYSRVRFSCWPLGEYRTLRTMVVYELFPPASLRMPRMVTKLINLQ
jgi:hypothetical protein